MTFAVLILRNLRRDVLQTTLTVVAIAFGLTTFLLLRTAVANWATSVNEIVSERVVTWNRVTFQLPMPAAYLARARKITAEHATTFGIWFGGRDLRHPTASFPTIATESSSYFNVYNNMVVPEAELSAWRADKQGAIIGDALAGKLGYKIGDRLTLESSSYPGVWELNVRGVYRATERTVDRTQLLFHWSYLNEQAPQAQRDQMGWMMSRVAGRSSAELASAIDAEFDNDGIQTSSMSEDSMRTLILSNFSALLSALNVASVIILSIIAVIVGNAVAMRIRERTREFGLLNALGFRSRHVVGLVVGEATAVAALGGVLGLVLSEALINRGLGPAIEESMTSMFPHFRVPPEAMLSGVLLAATIAALAALLPAIKAASLHTAEALRRVD